MKIKTISVSIFSILLIIPFYEGAATQTESVKDDKQTSQILNENEYNNKVSTDTTRSYDETELYTESSSGALSTDLENETMNLNLWEFKLDGNVTANGNTFRLCTAKIENHAVYLVIPQRDTENHIVKNLYFKDAANTARKRATKGVFYNAVTTSKIAQETICSAIKANRLPNTVTVSDATNIKTYFKKNQPRGKCSYNNTMTIIGHRIKKYLEGRAVYQLGVFKASETVTPKGNC